MQAQRLMARGYSARDIHLRMSRAEIGSYLGMLQETISLTFPAFGQQRLLEADKRHKRNEGSLSVLRLRWQWHARVHQRALVVSQWLKLRAQKLKRRSIGLGRIASTRQQTRLQQRQRRLAGHN